MRPFIFYTLTQEGQMDELTKDATTSIAMDVVEYLIKLGLVPDCTDSDDETEFEVQDDIEAILARRLHYYGVPMGIDIMEEFIAKRPVTLSGDGWVTTRHSEDGEINKTQLLKIIQYTFESDRHSGSQIRVWLQTVRELRDTDDYPYKVLTDDEFEALFRVYRFFWQEGEWLDKDTCDPFLAAGRILLSSAVVEISKAVNPSEIFPDHQDKVRVKRYGSDEFDWH